MATVERRLLEAVTTNKFEAVRCILLENPKIDLDKGQYLNWAAQLGRAEMVTTLIKAGADVNRYGLAEKETPLYSAVTHQHLSIAQALLEAGADANKGCLNGPSYPIMKACTRGMAALLIQYKVDVNVTDRHGVSALLKAVQYKRKEVVKLLLDAGANLLHKDKDGYTPLIFAVEKGYDDIVRALLEHGADAESFTPSGRTLLELASKSSTKALLGSYMPNSKMQSAPSESAHSIDKPGMTSAGDKISYFRSLFRTNAEAVDTAGLQSTKEPNSNINDPSCSTVPSAPPTPPSSAADDRYLPGAVRVGPTTAPPQATSHAVPLQQPPQPSQQTPRNAYSSNVVASALPVAAPVGMPVSVESVQQATAVRIVTHSAEEGVPVEQDSSRVLQLEDRVARLESLLAEQARIMHMQRLDINALKEMLSRKS